MDGPWTNALISTVATQTLEESQEMRRARGVEITRPFPNIIKVSHAVGWLLVVVGISEVIVGCILFKGGLMSSFSLGFVFSAPSFEVLLYDIRGI